MRATLITSATILLIMASAPARSQPAPSRANVAVGGGYAGVLDDGVIDHGVVGAGIEWVVTPRITVGPEVLSMVGPTSDRDLFVLGVAVRDSSGPMINAVFNMGQLQPHAKRWPSLGHEDV